MYKLIFVDDEAIVRNGVSSRIPWEELGFELSAVFEHGLEALEYIENNPVDLVLSDINMPRMSGLELSKVLGEKYPDIIVILLTGYDDFEYAQAAIRTQVREFILKPITKAELSDVLSTIKTELDDERAKAREQELLKARLDQSFPLLKERYLCRLISEPSAAESLAEKKEYYQWKDMGALYQVIVMAPPSSWNELERFALNERLSSLKVEEDEVFTDRADNLVLLMQSADPAELEKKRGLLTGETYAFASELDKGLLSIGCGETVDEPALLERSYQGAVSAVDYSRSLGLSQVVTIEEIRDRKAPSPEKLRLYQMEILDHLKDGRPTDSLDALKSMREYLEQHYQTPRDISLLFLQLFSRLSAFIQELDLTLPEERINGLDPESLESLIHGESLFISLIRNIGDQINRRRNDALLSRIDRAKAIIAEHYKNKDFSLQDICRELYLSTSQFSLLFKEGTGQTFVEYLTGVRMEGAKKLLLSTDMKSYEVAEQVGYSDPRYFSITFKKHCGMTAMEYRKTRDA